MQGEEGREWGAPPLMVYMGMNWGGGPQGSPHPCLQPGRGGGQKIEGGSVGPLPKKGEPIGESWDVQGEGRRGENGEPPPHWVVLRVWGGKEGG